MLLILIALSAYLTYLVTGVNPSPDLDVWGLIWGITCELIIEITCARMILCYWEEDDK